MPTNPEDTHSDPIRYDREFEITDDVITDRRDDSSKQRFGRLYAADPRDMDHSMSSQLRTLPGSLLHRQTQAWRRGPTLDQGNSSRCVQYALASCLGAAPFMHGKRPLAVTQQQLDGFPELYEWAQANDEFTGDESTGVFGTSGRAGMKYLRGIGVIDSYVWASHPEEAKDYISRQGGSPLAVGTDWFTSMMNPRKSTGLITDISGPLLGGHEWCALWFSKKTGLWKCQNSWGTGYGVSGIFYLPDELFQYLVWQANGDCAAMVETRK